MKNNYYVILTGSKNNAGDYLIKFRAKKLFAALRPDREIVDLDAWKPFDKETLKLVNESKALIMMGGPALRRDMYPGIYPLVDDLKEITTKITFMGLGWKNPTGSWQASREYRFNDSTLKLLARINSDGLLNSVRDYHSMNALWVNGFCHCLMTGCPATYDLDVIGTEYPDVVNINKIGFSLGVTFLNSQKMENQMKAIIIKLKQMFVDKTLEVAFHHSISDDFLKTHKATSKHLDGHRQFARWLEKENIPYRDISGSAENLMEYYSGCDMHIGYRVHAHIFMTSISKPTILIAEDGRGKALPNVFGGVVIDAFDFVKESFLTRVKRKMKLDCGYYMSGNIVEESLRSISYEISNNFIRCRGTRAAVDNNYNIMKKFMASLP